MQMLLGKRGICHFQIAAFSPALCDPPFTLEAASNSTSQAGGGEPPKMEGYREASLRDRGLSVRIISSPAWEVPRWQVTEHDLPPGTNGTAPAPGDATGKD